MPSLLERILESFGKAIHAEMEAMRQRLGTFEVPLAGMQSLDSDGEQPFYRFRILEPNDRLLAQSECTLRFGTSETLVTIQDVQQEQIILQCPQTIPCDCDGYTLVIYPWFLYERLLTALASLPSASRFSTDSALLLFGHGTPLRQPSALRLDHAALNSTQQRAVQLCAESNIAFVWGPPGTGKTTTLVHIICELLEQGHRILLTSTTNAAVDQALAKLARSPGAAPHLRRGEVVRIGQSSDETFGAGLKELTQRLNSAVQARLEWLRQIGRTAAQLEQRCNVLLVRLQGASSQLDLFRVNEGLHALYLREVFPDRQANRLAELSASRQEAQVAARRKRLQSLQQRARQRAMRLSQELRRQEAAVVAKARLLLSTMTGVYLSGLLESERFDVVVVEEAGMAILPTLFYCAALAGSKIIAVGDPQQLPPIVQSRDAYVFKAMGRTIFEVSDKKSLTEETMVMLDTQYRMHPVIGQFVSNLFYGGKLRHENTARHQGIADLAPYPGRPLVVLDSRGRTTCATEAGGFSRYNEKTAIRSVELAIEAVKSGIGSVAIITPYVAQARLIRQHLASAGGAGGGAIECRTVHRFQGNERDMVILDTVDTAPLSPGQLLTDRSPQSPARNLLNVSISRARGKLILIADVSYFARTAPGSIMTTLLGEAGAERVPF